MQPAIVTFVCLLAYIVGLIALVRMTTWLHFRRYDELMFMFIAAIAVVGSLLIFGAVAITFGVFNGALGIRALDFLFLLGIVIVAGGLAYNSFFSYRKIGVFLASRFITGAYNLLLFVVAFIYIVLLFK